jgi:hypothetical protein
MALHYHLVLSYFAESISTGAVVALLVGLGFVIARALSRKEEKSVNLLDQCLVPCIFA